MFYELLTGRLPFEATVAQLQYAIPHTDPAPPSEVALAARDLDPIVMTCLKRR